MSTALGAAADRSQASARGAQRNRHVQRRREPNNIVPPENRFQLAQIGLGQIRAGFHRPIVDAADFERQRVGLRRHQQIRAQAAKLARQAVTHVERHAERRRRHGRSQRESDGSEEFAARLAGKGVFDDAQEHGRLEAYCGTLRAAVVRAERSITRSCPSTCDGTATGLQPPGWPIEGP